MTKRIVARLMVNVDTGEGDLILDEKYVDMDPMWRADVFLDAIIDAEKLYNAAREDLRRDLEAKRKRQKK